MSLVKSISTEDGSNLLILCSAPSVDFMVELENKVRKIFNFRPVSASEKDMIKVHALASRLYKGPEPLASFLDRLFREMRFRRNMRRICYLAGSTQWHLVEEALA